MNRNIHHSQIIFLCFFLLVLVGCHNNAHLRTQKVLKPGEKAYSGSGMLAIGGGQDDYGRELRKTGVIGLRSEISMLKGGEDSESGPYLGIGALEDGPGLIAGYDYKKYIGLDSGLPKKLGAQFEVNISEIGQVFHLRPSITSTTKRGRSFYGGAHGLLAVGRLMDETDWYTIDSTWQDSWGYYGTDDYFAQKFDYNFTSLGAGLTAGVEFLAFNDNSFMSSILAFLPKDNSLSIWLSSKAGSSLQFQVDVSLVNNSFNTDFELPENAFYHVDHDTYVEREKDRLYGLSHSSTMLMVTGSAGISFFKPDPNTKKPLEPLPLPVRAQQPTYDPETGEKISSGMRFDPETGEAIIETQFDPETGVLEEKTESDDK
jgi:hypothetical protein